MRAETRYVLSVVGSNRSFSVLCQCDILVDHGQRDFGGTECITQSPRLWVSEYLGCVWQSRQCNHRQGCRTAVRLAGSCCPPAAMNRCQLLLAEHIVRVLAAMDCCCGHYTALRCGLSLTRSSRDGSATDARAWLGLKAWGWNCGDAERRSKPTWAGLGPSPIYLFCTSCRRTPSRSATLPETSQPKYLYKPEGTTEALYMS